MASLLIIDDDFEVREMLRQMFERCGHEVVAAHNGGAAIMILNEKPVDLIITDIIMPEKEGVETITEIKRDFPNIKIIAISGGGLLGPDVYLEIAKTVGAERTFTKPVERNKLLKAIEDLLD